jgi:hypothetical protein
MQLLDELQPAHAVPGAHMRVTIFLTPFFPYQGESPVAIRANRKPIWLPA